MKEISDRLYLIGPSGAGKTTIGKRLAEHLQKPFVDSDEWIECFYHSSIKEMVNSCGIEKFRKREQTALRVLSNQATGVIATGGGLPCHDNNIEILLNTGTVIYLSCNIAILTERLYICRHSRPLVAALSKDEIRAYLKRELPYRIRYYEQAHLTISADHMLNQEDEETIIQEIISKLPH